MNELYIHTKSGNKYIKLFEATLESSLVTVTVYKDFHTGREWVRPSNEFAERFTRCD